MKRFIYSAALLVSCLLVSMHGFAQEHAGSYRNAVSGSSVSDPTSMLAVAWDLFHGDSGKEKEQQSLQQSYPVFHKYPSSVPLREAAAGSTGKIEMSNYIFYAECRIVRFGGSDIIYPYNYPW